MKCNVRENSDQISTGGLFLASVPPSLAPTYIFTHPSFINTSTLTVPSSVRFFPGTHPSIRRLHRLELRAWNLLPGRRRRVTFLGDALPQIDCRLLQHQVSDDTGLFTVWTEKSLDRSIVKLDPDSRAWKLCSDSGLVYTRRYIACTTSSPDLKQYQHSKFSFVCRAGVD